MKFKLKFAIYKKVDVQEAGNYLTSKRDDRASDIDIVNDNKTDGPLHSICTWNNRDAADKLRVNELRAFERNLVVLDPSAPNKLQERPAIVRIRESLVKEDGSNFRTIAVTIAEVCSNEDMMNYVVEECRSELRSTVKKFNQYTRLQKHLKKIEQIVEVM